MAIAIITFWGPERGGRYTPPSTGYCPQVDIRGIHTSCMVESLEGEEIFSFEKEHRVLLKLMFPDQNPNAFEVGDVVSLYEGSKLIGSGKNVAG